jgi:hypothetical protein
MNSREKRLAALPPHLQEHFRKFSAMIRNRLNGGTDQEFIDAYCELFKDGPLTAQPLRKTPSPDSSKKT